MQEIAEAVMMAGAYIYTIRPVSYEVWALASCLTDVQYLWPVVKSEDKQVALLKMVIDKWLNRNVQRAAEGSCPLVYKEIMEIIKVSYDL